MAVAVTHTHTLHRAARAHTRHARPRPYALGGKEMRRRNSPGKKLTNTYGRLADKFFFGVVNFFFGARQSRVPRKKERKKTGNRQPKGGMGRMGATPV